MATIIPVDAHCCAVYSNGYIWSSHLSMVTTFSSRVRINRVWLKSCSWSGDQGKCIFPCPRSRRIIWCRGTGSAVPSRVSPLILHTQRLMVLTDDGIPHAFRGGVHLLFIPPTAFGSVLSLSGHAIPYRWRSLPRVRRHRASGPQGS